jgi:hypothetical protein
MAAPIGGIVPHHKAGTGQTAVNLCIMRSGLLPRSNIVTEILPLWFLPGAAIWPRGNNPAYSSCDAAKGARQGE